MTAECRSTGEEGGWLPGPPMPGSSSDKEDYVGDMQVKQVMEESVTRKFVHEESSTITSLCSKCLHYHYVISDSTVTLAALTFWSRLQR